MHWRPCCRHQVCRIICAPRSASERPPEGPAGSRRRALSILGILLHNFHAGLGPRHRKVRVGRGMSHTALDNAGRNEPLICGFAVRYHDERVLIWQPFKQPDQFPYLHCIVYIASCCRLVEHDDGHAAAVVVEEGRRLRRPCSFAVAPQPAQWKMGLNSVATTLSCVSKGT